MKQKVNFPLVVALIILSGVLLLVVAFQYDFSSSQKEEQQKEKQEEQIDISDWETYTNEEYSFELKYPDEEWNIVDLNSYNVIINNEETDNLVSFRGDASKCICAFSVSVTSKTVEGIENEIFNLVDSFPGNKLLLQREFLIEGVEGREYHYSEWESGASSMVVIIPKGSKTLILNSYIEPRTEEIFYEILASLKFLE